jgi:hypothetical protein
VLIKYQTVTTAKMLSAVVTPCGSISAHAVSHVPPQPQTNIPGTQLLHSTPVYLHTCAALCARRVRVRTWDVWLRVCVGRSPVISRGYVLVSVRFSHGSERYLSSHSKFAPPLQCPNSHCQNRAGSAWQIVASGQAFGGSTPGGLRILRRLDVEFCWISDMAQ